MKQRYEAGSKAQNGGLGNDADITMMDQNWPNLVTMFFEQAADLGQKPFLWAKHDGTYRPTTWAQAAEQVCGLAGGLRELGVKPGDRVVLVAENRPEWLIAELGIMATGAITVPAYTTNTVEDHLHIIENSGAKGAIVSSARLAERLIPAAHRAGSVEFIIGMEELKTDQQLGPKLLAWADTLAGRPADLAELTEFAGQMKRDEMAVIIYTSGTGGAPKGVMLHHGAILHNCRGATDALLELGLENEVFLSFLPLSHSYEHMAGQFFPISIGAQIYYSEGMEHLTTNMAEARPTIMTAVPRLYEVMHGRIIQGITKAGGLKQKLFLRAVELGRKEYEKPGSLSFGEKATNALLDRLVRGKVQKTFGGRLKALVSGGAPLNYDIGTFFTGLGLVLLQGYGLTETAPLISVTRPRKVNILTVGPPVLETEVKIAEDGEILARGEMVMLGYWRNEEATAAMIKDGWLHTGDVGVLDNEGCIQITDRKKDIIVNSGGDNLSPQRVEGFLVLENEIAQAMVWGDRRPHLVALIVPDADFALEWGTANGKDGALVSAVADDDFRKLIAAAVDRINSGLSNVERIRKFVLTAEPFTIDNEMMTPSLKVRRHKVAAIYGDKLIALYD